MRERRYHLTTGLSPEARAAICKKAVKDARRAFKQHGEPTQPVRQPMWTQEAWELYEFTFKDETEAINMGF